MNDGYTGRKQPDGDRWLHLRTSLIGGLQDLMADKVPPDGREKCFAEAADKVLSILRAEILDQVLQGARLPLGPTSASAGGLESPTARDFDRVVGEVLRDVQIGFLTGNLQMMKALGSAIAERDTGNSDHNYRVTLYAVRLAEGRTP